MEKQCKDIDETLKTDFEAIYFFLRSIDSKFSRPGQSF